MKKHTTIDTIETLTETAAARLGITHVEDTCETEQEAREGSQTWIDSEGHYEGVILELDDGGYALAY